MLTPEQRERIEKEHFRKWMLEKYGSQDADEFSGTFAEDIALAYAASELAAKDKEIEELKKEKKVLGERIILLDKTLNDNHKQSQELFEQLRALNEAGEKVINNIRIMTIMQDKELSKSLEAYNELKSKLTPR